MEIGSELFSMALALRLQRSTQSPDFASLKLVESPLSAGAFNTDWDALAVRVFFSSFVDNKSFE